MDLEARSLLRESLAAWCARGAARLEAMERGRLDPAGWERLYQELDELGVLHVLHQAGASDALATVAEVADCLAACSPSLALLVVQQNLAARLQGDAGAGLARGWVSLPLYDSAAEWPGQLRVTAAGEGLLADGCWGSLPGLPIASRVLLPLADERGRFALVRLELADLPVGVARGAPVATLGLRGCPLADLWCTRAELARAHVLAEGAGAARSVEALWSQAEVLVLAIRAGILERSYSVARAHAEARWQGSKLIREHSVVRRMLAELYGARCFVEESWRAMSATLSAGEPLTAGQLGLSLHLAALAPRLASDGIQVLGGYGYLEELGQERLFRDAKQCELLLGHPQAKSFTNWLRDAH